MSQALTQTCAASQVFSGWIVKIPTCLSIPVVDWLIDWLNNWLNCVLWICKAQLMTDKKETIVVKKQLVNSKKLHPSIVTCLTWRSLLKQVISCEAKTKFTPLQMEPHQRRRCLERNFKLHSDPTSMGINQTLYSLFITSTFTVHAARCAAIVASAPIYNLHPGRARSRAFAVTHRAVGSI